MKAVTIARQGDPVAPNIELVTDLPDPTAGPDQVVVRTEATALNHLDRAGRLPGLNLSIRRSAARTVAGSSKPWATESTTPGSAAGWSSTPHGGSANRCPRCAPGPRPTMIGEHDPGTHRERFVAPVSNITTWASGRRRRLRSSHLTAWGMLVNGPVAARTVDAHHRHRGGVARRH